VKSTLFSGWRTVFLVDDYGCEAIRDVPERFLSMETDL
jgi:hypothetical protein